MGGPFLSTNLDDELRMILPETVEAGASAKQARLLDREDGR